MNEVEDSTLTSVEIKPDNEEKLFFGDIGRGSYPPYAQLKIESKFGDKENLKGRGDRIKLWHNYENLKAAIATLGEADVLSATYKFIKRLNDFARKQLEECPPNGLGIHLRETREFSGKLLLDDEGRSRFPGVISDHNALLLTEVVFPMHDILKFLGTTDAQIMPDHEVITSTLIQENFVGRKVKLGNELYTLTQTDVYFISGVIDDHENIGKEEGRRDFISSDSELERAKALAFVVDALTGAIVPTDDTLTVDLGQLEVRFADLYFRHIDLVKGKIFRPQWGAYTVGDILSTLHVLEEKGLRISSPDGRNISQILISSALQTIDRAHKANETRGDSKFNLEQLILIGGAEKTLRQLQNNS